MNVIKSPLIDLEKLKNTTVWKLHRSRFNHPQYLKTQNKYLQIYNSIHLK